MFGCGPDLGIARLFAVDGAVVFDVRVVIVQPQRFQVPRFAIAISLIMHHALSVGLLSMDICNMDVTSPNVRERHIC
jgi:hypothetical protein